VPSRRERAGFKLRSGGRYDTHHFLRRLTFLGPMRQHAVPLLSSQARSQSLVLVLELTDKLHVPLQLRLTVGQVPPHILHDDMWINVAARRTRRLFAVDFVQN
jgi:hypothetical protein